jgi:hypothetical protein
MLHSNASSENKFDLLCLYKTVEFYEYFQPMQNLINQIKNCEMIYRFFLLKHKVKLVYQVTKGTENSIRRLSFPHV